MSKTNQQIQWGYLIHLGYNMWEDRESPNRPDRRIAKPYLRCDKPLWDELTQRFAEVGGSLLVIDLGEAVRYESHPELACKHAWSPAKLKREIKRLQKLGLEVIPKLNFSAAHDTWLGPYHRCVSTDTYYAVCRDLIEEVCNIFDQPRLFHLGMDEETFKHQRDFAFAVVRQHELWWHDLHFLAEQVERQHVRPWVWSDYYWHHPEAFLKNMPKSVLQSNWYYNVRFNKRRPAVGAYLDLEAHGYDQIPTGSNANHAENLELTARYLKRRIHADRLHGFLQTPWKPTLPEFRDHHLEAIEKVADAMKVF
ncbi:Tat pathway signal protein [Phycisphaerales bacterium AB-hyl4]|uniref:Tat pathway signal protein n=1 Tax=Natronomicrosphaera hydrolytica TaxID=3242702 RepID=A0ABV4U9F9_9BACT